MSVIPEAHGRQIAARCEAAHADFIETLRSFCPGLTVEEARGVKDAYLTLKLATLDWVMGRISVKHGSLLDESTIRTAAARIAVAGQPLPKAKRKKR